jgi:PKD repeat protein
MKSIYQKIIFFKASLKALIVLCILCLLKLNAQAQNGNMCNAQFKASSVAYLCPAGTDCKLLEQVVYTFTALDTTHCRYRWSFDDGTTLDGSYQVSKTYYKNGKHRVKLEVASHQIPCKTDGSALMVACSNSSTMEYTVNQLKFPNLCDAGFSYTKNLYLCPVGALCILPDRVEFTFVANNSEHCSYEWSFGDGTKGSGNQVKKYYTQNGQYTVKLSIKSKAFPCSKDSSVATVPECHASDSVIIFIKELNQQEPCRLAIETKQHNNEVKFYEPNASVDLSAQYIKYYRWSFGDGTDTLINSGLPNISHIYQKPGKYTAHLEMAVYDINKGEAVCQAFSTDSLIGTFIPCYYKLVCRSSAEFNINIKVDTMGVPLPNCKRNIEIDLKGNTLTASDFTPEILMFPGYYTADYYLWDFGDEHTTEFSKSQYQVTHTYTDTSKNYILTLKMARYKILDKDVETICKQAMPYCNVPKNLELFCTYELQHPIFFNKNKVEAPNAILKESTTDGNIELSIQNLNEPSELLMYNLSGMELRKINIPSNGNYQIPTQDLQAGMYLYVLKTNNKIIKRDKLRLTK